MPFDMSSMCIEPPYPCYSGPAVKDFRGHPVQIATFRDEMMMTTMRAAM